LCVQTVNTLKQLEVINIIEQSFLNTRAHSSAQSDDGECHTLIRF